MKTKLFKNVAVVFTILTLAFAVSCSDDDDEMQEDTTLYTRLGGIDAISAVTDQFLANVAADSKINARFEATVANSSRLQLLRNNLIDQICAGSGGPCQYKGKTMAAAHAGMGITQDEFNALVGDLVAALDKFSVPAQEKNDLLAILGPMQSDIVGK
jgi:hemoglobin